MPRNHDRAAPRLEYGTRSGAQAPAAYLPPLLGKLKISRWPRLVIQGQR